MPARVLIIGDFSFPSGMAATARVFAYARGLKRCGVEVKLLCLPAGLGLRRGPHPNAPAQGVHEGVEFAYVGGMTHLPDRFLGRRWLEAISPWLFLTSIWRETAKGRVGALLLYSESPLNMVLAFIASRMWGMKYVMELDELPYVYRTSILDRLTAKFIVRWLYLLPDMVVCISSYLNLYIAGHVRKGAQLIIVPALVDVHAFAPETPRLAIATSPYIAYSGELSFPKGVDIVISSMSALVQEFPHLQLKISGDRRKVLEYTRLLKNLTKSLDLEGRVLFLGLLPPNQLRQFLQNAAVLVVPHRSGRYSEAAFPTKLTEYLATGRPVVTTRVGEIDQYLTDDLDVFFAEPDAAAFTERLRYVLRHPSDASRVGQRGQAAAMQYFNYEVHGRRLYESILVPNLQRFAES